MNYWKNYCTRLNYMKLLILDCFDPQKWQFHITQPSICCENHTWNCLLAFVIERKMIKVLEEISKGSAGLYLDYASWLLALFLESRVVFQ